MRALDGLGVGDAVRALAPATHNFRLALDDAEVLAPMTAGKPGYCVRRGTLDPLLQEAAERAGAELRFQHKVVALSHTGERVTGVVVESARGRELLSADLVVGADGMHSTIAKLTQAPEYLAADTTRGGYWAYYQAPQSWPFPWDATLEHRGDVLRYVFRTDGDRIIAVCVPPLAETEGWGKSYRNKLQQGLAESPTTRALTEGKEPLGKIMGLLHTRFYYRQAVGPGWALIGDAGHYKDFVTGQGMTDAFFDAERLTRALAHRDREAALEVYWRERDAETLPVHFDALAQGAVGYNSPFMRWVFGSIGRTPEMRDRVRHVFDRSIPPHELVPMGRMVRWMAAALVRGRFDVLRGFLEVGKERGEHAREYAARQALLVAAQARVRASEERAASEPARIDAVASAA
jgi:menaquinone-9 beta-reductase